MSRPLMQHGVGQLEEMFAKARADPKLLKQLEHELQYRQVPRATVLLAEVQAAMYGGAPAPSPVAVPTHQPGRAPASAPGQPGLWEQPSLVLPAATPVAAQPRSMAPTVDPSLTRTEASPLLAMSIQDACKVLKTTAGATWESIEQARRLLVKQSHPSQLKPLSDERRAQALADARRANAAYATLQMARCGRT